MDSNLFLEFIRELNIKLESTSDKKFILICDNSLFIKVKML